MTALSALFDVPDTVVKRVDGVGAHVGSAVCVVKGDHLKRNVNVCGADTLCNPNPCYDETAHDDSLPLGLVL